MTDDYIKTEGLSKFLCADCLTPFYEMPNDGQAWYCAHNQNLVLWSENLQLHGAVFGGVPPAEAEQYKKMGKEWTAHVN